MKSRGSFSILLSLILFVGALVVYGNLIKPVYSDIKDLQAQQQEKSSEYDQYKSISDHMQSMISSYQNYSDLQSSIALSFPSDPQIPQIINQLNGLAVQSDVAIQSMDTREAAINPSTSSVVGSEGTVKINLKVSGRYEGFRLFLQKLENNIRIFSVKTLTVSKTSNLADNFDYNLEIEAYYQVPPQATKK